MVRNLPRCQAVVTAGQLATTLCCQQFSVEEPKVGEWAETRFEGRSLRIWRMPSSSRAYPLSVEKKAEQYKKVFLL
jgi:hypothetical protein